MLLLLLLQHIHLKTFLGWWVETSRRCCTDSSNTVCTGPCSIPCGEQTPQTSQAHRVRFLPVATQKQQGNSRNKLSYSSLQLTVVVRVVQGALQVQVLIGEGQASTYCFTGLPGISGRVYLQPDRGYSSDGLQHPTHIFTGG